MTSDTRSHGVTLLGPLHETLARATGWKAVFFAALLGAFAGLAFAPFNLTLALAIALIGLVWMIDGARGQQRWGRAIFARGWAFGFGHFLISMHWTAAPFLVEPEKHAIFLWMPLILLPGGMAIIWGAAMSMAGAFWSASPSRIFIFTLFFAMAEWVRGNLFGGFPWNLAGTSWVPGGAISQAASLGGIYWLTVITLFVCSAGAALVDTREARSLAMRFMPLLVAIGCLAGLWGWGTQRLSHPSGETDVDIVLMDVGVPQAEKYIDGRPNPAVFRRYLEFLRDIPARPRDIVIWPEGATGGYLLGAQQIEPVAAYLGDRTLIAGTVRYTAGSQGEAWYNSLAVLTADSARTGAAGVYDKHRLVPVGELPLARILPFGQQLAGILPGALQRMATAGYEPGSGPALVFGDTVPPFVAMICYEGLYPNIVTDAEHTGGERAEWIVVVSNDAWFGAWIGPSQHYTQNRYRAIESGLPLARVAARGTSAVVDGMGREILQTKGLLDDIPGWRGQVGRTRLPEALAPPLYQTRAGKVLFPLTLVFLSVLGLFAWKR